MLSDYRSRIERLKGQRDQINNNIDQFSTELKKLKKTKRNTETAQAIVQTVAQKTQEELTFHISDIVSSALSAIFDEPYSFKINFILKRGKTEAEIKLVRDGEEVDPLSSVGGGVVDVASFALRIAMWSLQNPKSNNVIILDEPMKFLSRELQPKAGRMIKMLSEKLNLQFIIISHDKAIIENADRVFEVTIRNGESKVEEV